jgi:hypothetical protein
MTRSVLVGALCLSITACGQFLFGPCGNEEISRLKSPDGKFEAVLFEQNCGATSSLMTNVSVVVAGEPLTDEGGNALSARPGHDGRGMGVGWGGPPPSMSWQDDRTLLIRYPPAAEIFGFPPYAEVATGWFSSEKVNLMFKKDG